MMAFVVFSFTCRTLVFVFLPWTNVYTITQQYFYLDNNIKILLIEFFGFKLKRIYIKKIVKIITKE